MVKGLIASAFGDGADMMVSPCPARQAGTEAGHAPTNGKHGTNLKTPLVYYSMLMAVAHGHSGKEAGLDGQVIPATQLEALARK